MGAYQVQELYKRSKITKTTLRKLESMCNLSAAFRTARTEQMQGQETWSVIFESKTGDKNVNKSQVNPFAKITFIKTSLTFTSTISCHGRYNIIDNNLCLTRVTLLLSLERAC